MQTLNVVTESLFDGPDFSSSSENDESQDFLLGPDDIVKEPTVKEPVKKESAKPLIKEQIERTEEEELEGDSNLNLSLGDESEPSSENNFEDDPAFNFLEHYFAEEGWELEEEEKKIFTEAGGSIKGLKAVFDRIVDERSESVFADETIMQLNEYVKNGGNVRDFYENVLNKQEIDYTQVDMEDLNTQKWVLWEYYKKNSGLTDKKIVKLIEASEEEGTLAEESLEMHQKLVEMQQQKVKQAIEESKKQKEAAIEKAKQDVQRGLDFIENGGVKELGLELTKGQKEGLKKFLFEYDPKTGRTQFQERLQKDPNLQYKLAVLTYTGVADGKLPKQAEKSAADKLLNSLKNQKGKDNPKYPEVNKKPKNDYTIF